jgi:hypothetical protein
VLTSLSRRDPDTNTTWVVEHLLKDLDDLDALLCLPAQQFDGWIDPQPILEVEHQLGDSGIALLDTADPLCLAAELFHLGGFTVAALTEPRRFHRLLERYAAFLYPRTEAAASLLPGRLWRIYGPEYATPPYLPPRLFRDYVTK